MHVRRHHLRHSIELLTKAPAKLPRDILKMLTRPVGMIAACISPGWVDRAAMGMLLLAAVFFSFPNTVYPDGQLEPAIIYYQISDPAATGAEAANQPPQQPELSYPESGDASVDLEPELRGSAFSDADEADSHLRTQWRIETSGSGLVVMDMICQGHNLTDLRLPGFILDPLIDYHLQFRYFDQSDQPSSWSIPVAFSTVTDPHDLNDNRVPDSQEIDFFVDLNQDSIDDAGQSSQIISILNYNGSLKLGLGVEAGNETIDIRAVENIDPSTLPEPFFAPEEMAYGLLRYKVSVPNPGEEVSVIIYLSDPISSGTPWMRYDSVMGWEDISAEILIDSDGTRIMRYVTDGGSGDADGVANGIIVDQIGPLTVENAAISNADGSAADGVDSTTCFIQTIGKDVK